jgi:hypothetical protein
MKVYFRFLGIGEVPRVQVNDHEVLTVESGEVRDARERPTDRIVQPPVHWYEEKHDIWFEHPFDLAIEIEEWVRDPEVATLREEIKVQVMRDARKLCTKSVLLLVQGYNVATAWGPPRHGWITPNPVVVQFGVAMVGFTGLNSMYYDWDMMTRGPSWEFASERFADLVQDGQSIPEGMTRYGITPRGKIINPLPPVCKDCGARHYGGAACMADSPGSFAAAIERFSKKGVTF